ncbi:scaffold attachment factor B1-like [Chenopodium quinoa]|uniref:RRM domain-containing protein n=1 Tax=Chenopodium quinoa TaxID=63459 RepID=A0A803LX81_CHEQI|nr:scaffold attachment factor B1-like [Chenopodium quinoa]
MSYSRRDVRSPSPYKRYGRSMSRSLSRSRSSSRSRSRSRESSVENPGNNLYVTGLSTRVTRRELEKHFSSEGKVEDVHLVTDPWTKESRGFGFVTMSSLEEADRCIKYLNRSVLEGRVITVEKARRRRGRTPTPGRYLGLRTSRSRGRSTYAQGLSLHTTGDHQLVGDAMIILLMKGTTEEGAGVTSVASHPGEGATHAVILRDQGEVQGGATLGVTHLDQGEVHEGVTHLSLGEAQGRATPVAIHQGQGRVAGEAVLAVYQEAPVGVFPIPLRSVTDPLIVTHPEATRVTVLPPDLGLFQNLLV